MNQAGLIVSIDFELNWGYNNVNKPLNIDEVFNSLHLILDLFKRYNIKSTWCVVGKLFENINETDSAEGQLNWIKENLLNNSLIEVGSHTYKHIFCEEVDEYIFEEDLKIMDEIADSNEIKFKAMIFPRNQFSESNLKILKKHSYTHYRSTLNKWYLKTNKYSNESIIKRCLIRLFELFPFNRDVVLRNNNELISISDSRFFRFFPSSIISRLIEPIYYRVLRYEMKQTFKRKKMYHIWFHPHNIISNPIKIYELEKFFKYYTILRGNNKIDSFKFSDIKL